MKVNGRKEKMKLENILDPPIHGWNRDISDGAITMLNLNYTTTLSVYKKLQYAMVQQFITIHGATKTDKPGLFPAGDVNRLLCADNFCYDTIYSIVMQDLSELYKIKGMGVARLRRIFDIINDLAGFDVTHTIHELKCIEYEEEIARNKKEIDRYANYTYGDIKKDIPQQEVDDNDTVYCNDIDDINAM
jgi:hypothetical protein